VNSAETDWRIYFTIHLLMVIATAIVMTQETALFAPRETWRDIVLPLGPSLMPVAGVGAPLALITPIATLFFLTQVRMSGWRALRAAIVAVVLTAAHLLAALPTFSNAKRRVPLNAVNFHARSATR
jgi:hypothetical protein